MRKKGPRASVRMHPLTLRFPEAQERTFLRDYAASSLKPVRWAALLAFILGSLFALLDAWLVPEALGRLSLIRFTLLSFPLLVLYLLTFTRGFTRFMQRAILWTTLVGGLGIVGINLAAPPPEAYAYYVGLILATIFYFTFLRLQFVYAVVVAWTVVLTYLAATLWIRPLPPRVFVLNSSFLLCANVVAMFAGYFLERAIRTEYLERRASHVERARSERLLRNILPEPVADRLKQGEVVIAESFPEVTVLFADLVDFTQICERSTPGELVEFLTEVFSVFDGLAARHGVEKIKTMGDAYMVAGGLPVPRPDHAEAVAEMALAMQDELQRLARERQEPLRLRIGMHTGSVVAGVIGTRKFSYDLWGDTVNTASRMQSHGDEGMIQVTRETYERLREAYHFEERGTIDVKGKGRVSTYFLLGRKQPAAA